MLRSFADQLWKRRSLSLTRNAQEDVTECKCVAGCVLEKQAFFFVFFFSPWSTGSFALFTEMHKPPRVKRVKSLKATSQVDVLIKTDD